MSTYSTLEFSLKEILQAIKPLEGDWIARVHVINEFRAVVQSVESLRGATVEPFGSFVSNLYTRWGDLDISIELPNGSDVSYAGKNYKQKILRDVMRALRRKGVVRKIQFIPHARVPLIIFESNHNNISCDVSINNPLGQLKSKFLLWISQIDERFHDMVLLVKEWAKALNINDPKSGTLNSYSLCLLVIFHFQTCRPAILPPLKEIYAGNIAESLTGRQAALEREIEETCAANIRSFRSSRFRTVNQSSLSELFIAFFKKFSEVSLKASEQAICTYTGQWEDIKSKTRWISKNYVLLIEDPFEQSENAARAVGIGQLVKIAEAFEVTYRKLLLASHDQNSLIASLVRPEIRSQFLTRTSRGSPSKSGGRPVSRPQLLNAIPSTTQNRFQDLHLETSPTPSQPRRAVRGRGQQVWMPKDSGR